MNFAESLLRASVAAVRIPVAIVADTVTMRSPRVTASVFTCGDALRRDGRAASHATAVAATATAT